MKRIALAIVAAALTAGSVHAVTLAPGTMETRVSGQFDSTTLNGALTELNISWGYFFRDNLQAGARIGFFDNENVTLYTGSAFTEYNFEIGSEDWLPFVEGALGFASGDGEGGKTESALTAQGQIGIKYFLAPNVAISTALVIDVATEHIYPDDDEYDSSDTRLQLAIRYYY